MQAMLPPLAALSGSSRAANGRTSHASAVAHGSHCFTAAKASASLPRRNGAGCPRPSTRLAAATEQEAIAAESAAATTAGAAWDPDGLLPPPPVESHFARRARERAAATGVQLQQEGGVRPVPAEHLAAGGLPAADGSLYDRPAFEKQLADRFMPVDLDTPGLRILHFDPPVFALPGFFTDKECDKAVEAAVESGTLVPSKIGGGNLRDLAAADDNTRRTSSSVLLDVWVQRAHPRLREMAQALQAKGLQVLGQGDGASWSPPGKLPPPGRYCYESLQMARYEQGQHFLAHEDGFPPVLALQNSFQRHATLLIYLNTTQQGGCTRFDMLNLAVHPQKGKALLFFPSFADGTADPRSLHTAEDAADTKWVTQQWVARGLAGTAIDPIEAALAGSLPLVKGSSSKGAEQQLQQRLQQPLGQQQQQQPEEEGEAPSVAETLLAGKRGKGKKGAKKPASKGFGA